MYIIFFKKNWGVTCVTCYIYKTLIWETHVTCGVTCGVTCITCQDISSCSWWQFKFCLYYWFCTMCLLCLRFFWVGNDFCTRDFLRERERKIERDREAERQRDVQWREFSSNFTQRRFYYFETSTSNICSGVSFHYSNSWPHAWHLSYLSYNLILQDKWRY